ncbi:hypothetical protein [Bacteroides acidifaciens]|jgi:hypothetical protein|uniref:hypothetical protein n=1 Tax=Bacteroides acidifaciens TaxID=85831 RepID=UPI00242D7E7B|nr:hypothetical protein [Bacteroides acidifaciens]
MRLSVNFHSEWDSGKPAAMREMKSEKVIPYSGRRYNADMANVLRKLFNSKQ